MAGLQDLSRDFAKRFKVTQADARKCIEFVCDNITERIGKGETVSVRGFGVFKAKPIGPREIKNPQTREPVTLGPSVRICFTATERLKNEVKYAKGLLTEEEYAAASGGRGAAEGEDAGDSED
jgi:nucleoid DNA-binding protein